MNKSVLLACLGVGLAVPAASAQNLLFDGSFETGGFLFGSEIDPMRWDDFGNATLYLANEAPVLAPPPGDMPADPDPTTQVGIKMFAASFGSYQFSVPVGDLPAGFDLALLPGGVDTDGDGVQDQITDADGDGFPEVEVTDSLGTRMVEYRSVPATGASLWRTFIGLDNLSAAETGSDAASFTPSSLTAGDEVRFRFNSLVNSADQIQPNGALLSSALQFRTAAPFPAAPVAVAEVDVNIGADTANSLDQFVEYELLAVVPEGAVRIEVQALHFGLFVEFVPRDDDGDGIQDTIDKDGNFNGVIEPGEQGVDAFVGPEGPAIDTDGDGMNDAFETFVTIDGSVGGGAAFLDNFSLENLGPADLACNPADIAEPFGMINFADVTAFINLFNAGDLTADINGSGALDFGDATTFIAEFNAGCP